MQDFESWYIDYKPMFMQDSVLRKKIIEGPKA